MQFDDSPTKIKLGGDKLVIEEKKKSSCCWININILYCLLKNLNSQDIDLFGLIFVKNSSSNSNKYVSSHTYSQLFWWKED